MILNPVYIFSPKRKYIYQGRYKDIKGGIRHKGRYKTREKNLSKSVTIASY